MRSRAAGGERSGLESTAGGGRQEQAGNHVAASASEQRGARRAGGASGAGVAQKARPARRYWTQQRQVPEAWGPQSSSLCVDRPSDG